MFKKILSILLSITLLLTICPVTGVFAASEVTEGTVTENFEDMEVTNDYFAYGDEGSQLANHKFFTDHYYSKSTSTTSTTFNSSYASYKIVNKQGADEKLSQMLEMRSPVTKRSSDYYRDYVGLGLPSYEQADYNAGKRFTYSFDFCLENIPDEDKFPYVYAYPYLNIFHQFTGGLYSVKENFNSSNFVIGASRYTKSNNANAELKEGEWYRAEMVMTNKFIFSIYDKNGTRMYKSATNQTPYDTYTGSTTLPKNAFLAAVSLYPVTEENAGFTVLIDNIEYKVCKPASAGPAIKTGSTFTEPTIKNGDTVELNVGQATVAFDQQLKDSAQATLTFDGTTIKCDMTPGKAYANSYFYTVTLPELKEGTNYKLSFDNCKNSNEKPVTDTIAFKTEGGASEKAEVSNVSFAGVASGDEITFDYLAKEAGETVFIAAFYDKTEDKNLVGAEILIKNDVIAGDNKITITLENDYSDDAQNFVIYTWNNLEDITPLTDTVNTPIN